MKELTIEEKAEAYDRAIERAKKWRNAPNIDKMPTYGNRIIEEIFPELKESERIRKYLLSMFSDPNDSWDGISAREIIAWLEKQGKKEQDARYENLEELLDADNIYQMAMNDEMVREAKEKAVNALHGMCIGRLLGIEKQGEQNLIMAKSPQLGEHLPADKVEPKFHEGDWVVSPNGVYWHIDKIYNNRYEVTSNTGESSNWNLDANIYHRFTIQDAKDGDVLVVNNEIFIYAHRKQMYSIAVAHCFVDSVGGFYLDGDFGYTENGNSIHPATKEQCNQLGKAMTDAGYTFDFEKKELKKVENETEIPFGAKDSELQEATYFIPQGFYAEIDDDKVVIKKGEKPTAWSDGDKKMSRFIGNAITADDSSVYLKNKGIEVIDAHVWLDELKDRVQPQPKQEWSEEDALRLEEVICMIEANGRWVRSDDAVKLNVDWLKSLKYRVGCEAHCTTTKEWSEEDEKIFNGIILRCKKYGNQEQIDWLKSLRPQKQWKPSEKQMEALDFAANCIVPAEFCVKRKVLKELLEQLKKLREEKL